MRTECRVHTDSLLLGVSAVRGKLLLCTFDQMQSENKYGRQIDHHGVFIPAVIAIGRPGYKNQHLYSHRHPENKPEQAFSSDAVQDK